MTFNPDTPEGWAANKAANDNARECRMIAEGKHGVVLHSPEKDTENGVQRFAPNMEYVVIRDGKEVYRGPQWQAHIHANTGIPYSEQRHPHE